MNNIFFLGLVTAAALSLPHSGVSAQIRVSASGSTFEQAKQNAFTRAIEYYSGSAIISSTRVQGEGITEQNILSYSSGYIKNYTVVNQRLTPTGVTVVLDVYPASSTMHGAVVQSNGGATIPGSATAALQTYSNSQNSGRMMIREILRGWPEKAVKVDVVTWRIGNDGQPYIDVTVRIGFNQRWSAALEEAVMATATNPATTQLQSLALFSNLPQETFGMTWRAYGWPNHANLQELRANFAVKQPYLKIALTGGLADAAVCQVLDVRQLMGDSGYNGLSATKFYFGAAWNQTERIYLGSNGLADANRIEASAVSGSTGCT